MMKTYLAQTIIALAICCNLFIIIANEGKYFNNYCSTNRYCNAEARDIVSENHKYFDSHRLYRRLFDKPQTKNDASGINDYILLVLQAS